MIFSSVKDQLCPYCFERFRLASALFRCTNLSGCATELDEAFADAWNLKGSDRNVAIQLPAYPAVATKEGAACPKCSKRSSRRVCPRCRMDLPDGLATGANPSLLISLIGAKDTGKSHYLAVLINHFRKRVGPDMGVSLGHLTKATIDRYNEHFFAPLYERHDILRTTASGVTEFATRMPQIWGVSRARERRFWEREDKVDFASLVFFDTAGEDLKDEDVMAQVNRYVYRSDGIVLLLDPLQIDAVRSELEGKVPLPRKETAPWQIVQSVQRLIRKGLGLPHTAKIPIPVAVAFSKFDAVRSLVSPHFQVLQAPDRAGGFDPADQQAVNDEMRRLLEKWDLRDLLQQVDTNFSNVRFFGLSALGAPPTAGGKVEAIVPHRVEDPLLWLLHRNKLVPTRVRG